MRFLARDASRDFILEKSPQFCVCNIPKHDSSSFYGRRLYTMNRRMP
jgi:hypothetical protein